MGTFHFFSINSETGSGAGTFYDLSAGITCLSIGIDAITTLLKRAAVKGCEGL